jgi:hypothetical protein
MEAVIGVHARAVESRSLEALHKLWGATWAPRLSLGQRVRIDQESWLDGPSRSAPDGYSSVSLPDRYLWMTLDSRVW